MANKRKLPASKPKATTERIEVRQPIAEYILSVQDKKFTQIQINQLLKIYESTEPSDFVRQFLEVFQVVICEDLKSKRADNILSFYLAFMMALEGDETHLLWEEFFNWILNHKNMQTHVRIRMCQFIEQFLGAMNMNAVLDANICEGIERYMILNADDFSNLVRSVALNGLQRLQDPTNPTAATWKHYLFHLNDPAPNVRKSVITSICKNRFSIPKLLEHLLDKVDTVRSHLVQSLANVSYKHYKTEDRIKLIEDGLGAHQPQAVINGIQDTILASWFVEMDRNYVKLTKALLLETSWKEFQRSASAAKRALKYLFSVDPVYLQYLENQLTRTDNDLMDSICDSVERSMVLDGTAASLTNNKSTSEREFENCIEMNRLTPEVAIYWCAVLEYYQENNEDDGVFPELSLYLKYVEAYGKRSINVGADLKHKRRFQYVFGLLVDTLRLYDFKDECCRTFLKETSGRLILSSHIKKDTLRALIQIHSEVYPEEMDYLDAICLTIRKELSEATGLNETGNSTRGTVEQEARIKHYLKVVYLLLVNRRIRTLTPSLRTLFETVIFPRIENGDRKIRIWSTKCTATYAAMDAAVAQTFYHKLIAQLQVQHNVPVWAVIIESIFDLLARYGIEFLGGGGSVAPPKAGVGLERNSARTSSITADATSPEESDGTCAGRTGRALYNTTSECWGVAGGNLDESAEQSVNILEVLQTLYDDCSDLLIVRPIVLGFCRLILTEQCQSVELMMKLLVTFFTTDTYPELVQILGAFFVELCENQLQDLLVIALLPTMEYVMANPNLPIDVDSVVQFVVDSTSLKSSGSQQYHLKLAHLFVDTIQANEKQRTLIRVLFKYLSQLDFPEDAVDAGELERICASLSRCELLKPEQVETVRRKLSGVRRVGSAIAEVTECSGEKESLEAVQEASVEEEAAEKLVPEEERMEEAEQTTDVEQTNVTERLSINPQLNETETRTSLAIVETILEANATVDETVEEHEEEDEKEVTIEEEETDCSVSSHKENRAQRGNAVRKPLSTAIPRLVLNGGQTEAAVKHDKISAAPTERRLRGAGPGLKHSKIPVMEKNSDQLLQKGSKKRALDKSLTMTPNVKQKRADSDANVRKRQSGRSTIPMSAAKTPTREQLHTKSTSTPINEWTMLRESRVVLSPIDMSLINKTRPTTRSVTVHTKRALRTRNVK